MTLADIFEGSKSSVLRKTLKIGSRKDIKSAVRGLKFKSNPPQDKDVVSHAGVEQSIKREVPGQDAKEIINI